MLLLLLLLLLVRCRCHRHADGDNSDDGIASTSCVSVASSRVAACIAAARGVVTGEAADSTRESDGRDDGWGGSCCCRCC